MKILRVTFSLLVAVVCGIAVSPFIGSQSARSPMWSWYEDAVGLIFYTGIILIPILFIITLCLKKQTKIRRNMWIILHIFILLFVFTLTLNKARLHFYPFSWLEGDNSGLPCIDQNLATEKCD